MCPGHLTSVHSLSVNLTPKLPLLSIFSLTYLYLATCFTYIWLYLRLRLPLFGRICALIALIGTMLCFMIHPIYAFFYWDCTPVQNFVEQFRTHYSWSLLGPVLPKTMGDTSVVKRPCSLGVNLRILLTIFLYAAIRFFTSVYECWKSTRTMYLLEYSQHFEDLGEYASVVIGCERSCQTKSKHHIEGIKFMKIVQ